MRSRLPININRPSLNLLNSIEKMIAPVSFEAYSNDTSKAVRSAANFLAYQAYGVSFYLSCARTRRCGRQRNLGQAKQVKALRSQGLAGLPAGL